MAKGSGKPARGRPALTEAQRRAARAQIVSAASDLFRREGFQAISMRRLADAAGCAPMTLYAYFPAKADILREIWSDHLVALFRDLRGRIARISAPEARLRVLATGYVAYWLDNPDTYRMVFMTEGVTQADVEGFVSGGAAAHYALFTETIASAVGGGPAALKERSDFLVCGLHGLAHNIITIGGYRWTAPKRIIDRLVRATLA